ncbi:hypothetical protein AMTRI_Chr13g123380 [Amborella trichopoda]
MPLHSQELERALDPLLENEIFCCIPVEDGALIKKGEHSWVPEEVDIKQHIKWNIGDLVQDEEETGKSFDERCLTKITSVALERSKLLWEVYVLNVATKEAKSLLVFKAHHSLGDGASLISLFMSCTETTNQHSWDFMGILDLGMADSD